MFLTRSVWGLSLLGVITLPSDSHANLHNPALLIPRDDASYTPTTTASAPDVTNTLSSGTLTAINAFLKSNASDNGVEDLSLPGFSAMCVPGKISNTESIHAAAATIIPPCLDCSTVSGVLLASIASTEVIFLSAPATISGSRTTASYTTSTPMAVSRSVASKRGDGPPPYYPLLKPDPTEGNNSQLNFMRRLDKSVPEKSEYNIAIKPRAKQLENWFVRDRKGLQVPIGVTAEFFPFGKKPQTYKMVGLSGCTAAFVISRYGMWVGHFWEGSGQKNGYGSFKRWSSKALFGAPRSDESFKLIAADILIQRTPHKERSNRPDFISLRDLAESRDPPYDDPFRDGEKTEVYILTKAAGPREWNATQIYASKIKLLQDAITSIIPEATFNIRTYIGVPQYITVPRDLNGITIIQYSPFSAYDGNGREACHRVAEVKVWSELNEEPAISKAWRPRSRQSLSKRQDGEDDTCELAQSSVASSISGNTTPMSSSSVTSMSSASIDLC